MKKNQEFIEKICNWLTLLIGVVIFSLVFNFLRTDVVLYEDTCQIFFNIEKFSDLYVYADHGCLISWIVMKIVGSVFPLITGTHPNCNWLGSIFISCTIALYVFLVSSFSFVSLKEKIYKPFLYLTAFAFLAFMFVNYSLLINLYCRYFRNVFMMLFYLLFWLHFLKIFVEQKNNPKNIVLISIISFCAGLSSEPVNLSAFFSLIILVFTQMIIVYLKTDKDIRATLEIIKKTDKSIFIPLICFFAGFILLYVNPTFWQIANERHVSTNMNDLSILINLLPDFVRSWSLNLFKINGQNILSNCLILCTIICLLMGKKDLKAIRIVLASWSLVIGVCLFYFSLIMAGKTYYDGVSFWTVSGDLKSVVFCIFSCAVFLLAGYIIQFFVNKLGNVKAFVCFLLVFTLILIVIYQPYKIMVSQYEKHLETNQKTREIMYIVEKMYVFYNLKNETAILPKSVLEDDYFKLYGLYSREDGGEGQYVEYYYKSIYHKDSGQFMKIVPDKIALKKFYEAGGTFVKGEIEKANFTNLLDENFVLGKIKI